MLEYAPTLAELDQIVWPMDLLPDEAVMLVVKYPVKAFRIESVELYTAGDPANPPVGDTIPGILRVSRATSLRMGAGTGTRSPTGCWIGTMIRTRCGCGRSGRARRRRRASTP